MVANGWQATAVSRLSKGDDICGWCLGGRLKIYLAGHIPGAVDVSTVRRLAFQVREVVVDARKGFGEKPSSHVRARETCRGWSLCLILQETEGVWRRVVVR